MNKIRKYKNSFRTHFTINGKIQYKYFKTYSDAENWLIKIMSNHSVVDLENEIWKPIPFFSRYMASNKGRLKSLNYKNSGIEKIIKPAKSSDGYLKTMLQNDSGRYKSWTVHKFICLAFYGEKVTRQDVNHIDGNKLNNSIENLEYCSHSYNVKHAFRIGLAKPLLGSSNGNSKLTEQQVKEIREAKRLNGRYWGRNDFAKKFNIDVKHIQAIANDSTIWPHV